MSKTVSKFLPKYHQSFQGKKMFDLQSQPFEKFVMTKEDKKLVDELKELGKKTIESEKQIKEIVEESRNILEESIQEENSENKEEFLESIKQLDTQNNSAMKISDLNIHELCDLKDQKEKGSREGEDCRVRILFPSNPKKELNEKYLLEEAAVDRRNLISSKSNV